MTPSHFERKQVRCHTHTLLVEPNASILFHKEHSTIGPTMNITYAFIGYDVEQ